jgi:hypothetical protein
VAEQEDPNRWQAAKAKTAHQLYVESRSTLSFYDWGESTEGRAALQARERTSGEGSAPGVIWPYVFDETPVKPKRARKPTRKKPEPPPDVDE